ncbi:MAG: FG-GAP-like repeat-containing protein [Saprospiraceae bacterium]
MKNMYNFLFSNLFTLLFFSSLNGQVSFTIDNTTLSGAGSYEDCVVDMNGDHLDDIVRVNPDKLTINYQEEDGSFSETEFNMPLQNLPSWSMCAGDLDGNGYNDLLLASGDRVSFLFANSDGTDYAEQYKPEYIFSQRSTLADIDNDGNLDAFVCHDIDQSHPYRNDGTGLMTLDQSLIVTDDSPGNYSAIWVDYDNDGDSDVYVSKCIFGSQNPADPDRINKMYRNNGDGTYTEVGEDINMADNSQSWTTVFEDFDNDGDFDAFIVNHDFKNLLMRNDNGVFTDVTDASNLPMADLGSWEGASGDFNNDGFVDIFGDFQNELYINNGDMTFTAQDLPFQDGGIGDLNDDGFLDVVRGNNIYYNEGNDNNWVKINTLGIFSNNNGIGARVEIHGSWGVQIREVRSGQSFSPMSSLTIHFGIGEATEIDNIVIKWPSGIITNLENPAINQTHNLVEAECLLTESELQVDGDLMICEGESVTLNAPDGFNEYLWSNGQTSQSITVSNSGNYSATLVMEDDCVSLSNTINVDVTDEIDPIIELQSEGIVCEGDAVFLGSLNGENPVWSNGVQGNTLAATETGTYYVSVDALCATGQIQSEGIDITVIDAAEPTVEDVQLSAPGPATFTATGADNVEWYDQPTDGTLLGAGPSYTIPQVDIQQYIYAQATTIDGGEIQTGGKIGFDGSGGLPGSGAYSRFDCWEPFTLLNVTVQAFFDGERNFELYDGDNTLLDSRTIFVEEGIQTLEFNFEIPEGEGLYIRCIENDLFRNDGGVNYPYAIGSVGELTGSFFGAQFYYYFYDWEIEKQKVVCVSDRVEAVAAVVSSTDDLNGALSNLSISPNPATDFVNVNFNSNQSADMLINLLDATGKKVVELENWTINNGKNETNIDVSDLPKGLYYLQFNTNGKSVGRKVVVQ